MKIKIKQLGSQYFIRYFEFPFWFTVKERESTTFHRKTKYFETIDDAETFAMNFAVKPIKAKTVKSFTVRKVIESD